MTMELKLIFLVCMTNVVLWFILSGYVVLFLYRTRRKPENLDETESSSYSEKELMEQYFSNLSDIGIRRGDPK